MTPAELDQYLTIARKHGSTIFRMGDVEVHMLPSVEPGAAGSPSPPTMKDLLNHYGAGIPELDG